MKDDIKNKNNILLIDEVFEAYKSGEEIDTAQKVKYVKAILKMYGDSEEKKNTNLEEKRKLFDIFWPQYCEVSQ